MFLVLLALAFLLAWKIPYKRCGLLCDPTGGVATLAIMGVAGVTQAVGQYQQGQSQNSYYQYLAGQSRLDAQAAYDRSLRQSELVGDTAGIQNKNLAIKSAETSSTQKAQMAASGLDLSSVTAQDLTLDTLTRAKMDEAMIRRNANLESWQTEEQGKYAKWQGEEQAKQYGYAGKQAKKAANIQSFTTLLGTAASMGLAASNMEMFSKVGSTVSKGSTLPSNTSVFNQPSASWLRKYA